GRRERERKRAYAVGSARHDGIVSFRRARRREPLRRRRQGGDMGQSIRDIMTSNPSTVEPDKTVVDAARIMKQEDAGVVPVTENGRLTGMVTDRDIAIRVVAEGRDPQSTPVREVASKDLVTVDPQQDLD